MAKYRVHAKVTEYLWCEIEAVSIEDANEKAYDLDGGEFNTTKDWSWENVPELTEEA